MTTVLESLRNKNPDLKILSVFDPEFSRYGRVLTAFDTKELAETMAATEIPQEGNCYVASHPALEALPVMDKLCHAVYGEMPLQAGYCNGHGFKLNSEEYHKCSELNFTTTGLVLLLAAAEDIHDWKLDSADVVGFYLPPNVLVEINPLALHFAPCRISDEGFNCLVILEKGTNSPLSHMNNDAKDEEKLLWMTNKWLICHPDSPQAQKGAFIGITGKNLELHI